MFFSSVNQTAHCDQLESAGATGDYDEDVSAYSQYSTVVRQHACTASVQDLSWLCVEWMNEICRYVFRFLVGSSDCAVFLPGCISASEMTYIVSSGALNSTHSLTPGCISDRLPPWRFPRFERFWRLLPGFLAVVPSESIRLIILSPVRWFHILRGNSFIILHEPQPLWTRRLKIRLRSSSVMRPISGKLYR